MKLVNENFEVITMDEVDLTKGYLSTVTLIRDDAEPIDDVTKFAWVDEDYEEVKIYRKFTEEELEMRNATAPKSNAELEAENKLLKEQVSALSEQMDFYEECMVEMAMVVYA